MTESEKKDVHGFINNLWQEAKSGDDAAHAIIEMAHLMHKYLRISCNAESVEALTGDCERLYHSHGDGDTTLQTLMYNVIWALHRTQEDKRCRQ